MFHFILCTLSGALLNILISQMIAMVWLIIGIVSSRRFQGMVTTYDLVENKRNIADNGKCKCIIICCSWARSPYLWTRPLNRILWSQITNVSVISIKICNIRPKFSKQIHFQTYHVFNHPFHHLFNFVTCYIYPLYSGPISIENGIWDYHK